jgi:hypothetical protein
MSSKKPASRICIRPNQVHYVTAQVQIQEFLGRTNLPTFPMTIVAIDVTMATIAIAKIVCDVTKITQQSNNPNNNPTIKNHKPLLCKAENHAPN